MILKYTFCPENILIRIQRYNIKKVEQDNKNIKMMQKIPRICISEKKIVKK